jgi:hypothetical protein
MYNAMKVMGSSLLTLEAIVIGLAMPIAIVVGGEAKGGVMIAGFSLMALCILAVGGVRQDRKTAIRTCALVQLIVIAVGLKYSAFLFPGFIFLLVLGLAIRLSARVDAAKALN